MLRDVEGFSDGRQRTRHVSRSMEDVSSPKRAKPLARRASNRLVMDEDVCDRPGAQAEKPCRHLSALSLFNGR